MPVLRSLVSRFGRVARPGDASRFWLAQIFLIISTVIGVYLAAYVGFEKAVEFDILREQRTTYYMLGALRGEVEDNLDKVDRLLSNFTGRIDMRLLEREAAMQTYVWETMQESSETFRIPDIIITGVRRYYATVAAQVDEVRMERIARRVFVQRLRTASDALRRDVLPAIEKERQRLYDHLRRRGIGLE